MTIIDKNTHYKYIREGSMYAFFRRYASYLALYSSAKGDMYTIECTVFRDINRR